MYRGGGHQLIVQASDCRVLWVEENVFGHRCDTGAGATGAPILTLSGDGVVGLHLMRRGTDGVGARSDRIIGASEVLKRRVSLRP
jgi:hypothetical protein